MDRKFYIYDSHAIQYQWGRSGLFRSSPNKYYFIMIYEQNGAFFELLTGQFLGIRKNYGSMEYIFSDEFGYSIPLSGWSVQRYAHVITPESFANQARKYMEEKNLIIPYIHNRFKQWRSDYQKLIEQERQKQYAEAQRNREDVQNINWLSDMLNKRK